MCKCGAHPLHTPGASLHCIVITVTMNTYTHLGLDDAKNEMIRLEELEQARKEVDKVSGKKELKKSMFKIG